MSDARESDAQYMDDDEGKGDQIEEAPAGGDGLHYGGTAGTQIAESWAQGVIDDILASVPAGHASR